MLIYNFQKEFLGIDQKDLQNLGFHDLASLRAEAADFADLFVKTPGHIHNFRHVHWIDFITCAESNEKPKAIINVNSKNYKCTLDIKTAYLTDYPNEEAYLVYLNNLRLLTEEEIALISSDLSNKTTAKPYTQEELTKGVDLEPEPVSTPFNLELDEFETTPQPTYTQVEKPTPTPTQPTPIEDDNDLKLDISFDDETPLSVTPTPQKTTPQAPLTQQTPQEELPDSGYVYDPQVASDELGLPLDLIEEFIQDFILQANDFKEGLYTSLENGDLENVKILSHKLKGVAANLRIEDAFETLTTINTSGDTQVIRKNLDLLYRIIAKLSGEEEQAQIQPTQQAQPTPQVAIEETPQTQPLIIDDENGEDQLKLDVFMDDEEEKNLKVEEIPTKDETTVEKEEPLEIQLDLEDEEDEEVLKLELDLDDEIQEIPQTKQKTKPPPHYSKTEVAQEIGIDLDTFNELLEDYKQESQITLKSLEEIYKRGDMEKYQLELTKFKGMTDNMRIKDFLHELEILENPHNEQSLLKTIQHIQTMIDAIIEKRD